MNREGQDRSEWEEVRIGDLGDVVAGGTPSRSIPGYWNGTIPWITPSEVTKVHSKYIASTVERITDTGLAASAAQLLPAGTVLVTSRATLGETAIAAIPLTTNQGFKNIVPNGATDSEFVYYLIPLLRREMVRLASGTTFLEISKADFTNIRCKRPLKAQQRRIAAVLDAMDEAIVRTEAMIAKLRLVRDGLLQDILTRGLDHNGELRDPIAHPEQFQETPFGRFPKKWEIVRCEELCREIVVGIVVRPAKYYRPSGVPVLRSANIRDGWIARDDLVFISKEDNNLLSKSILWAGDMVTVRTGYPGTSAVVPADLNGCNCVDLVISRPKQSVAPSFLTLWVNSPFGRDQVLRVQGGLAQQHFNVSEMRELLVPRMDRQEQQGIVDRLEAMDGQLNCLVRETDKLAVVKAGLMSDLLTGLVRVPESIPLGDSEQ